MHREHEYFNQILSQFYGQNSLQCGLHYFRFLSKSLAKNQFYIQSVRHYDKSNALENQLSIAFCKNYYELPFESHSLDVIVLPHILEFRQNPVAVLDEITRVLALDGKLIISGFNPLSLLGLSYRFKNVYGKNQKGNRFIELEVLKRWLKESGYEIQQGKFLSYLPPIQSNKWIKRLRFLDKAGDRWWAVGGSVYFLQAIKRTIPLKPIFNKNKRFKLAMPTPAMCFKK